MSSYKNFSPKCLQELCCWICGKLDKDVCQLENGSRICSKCPATSSEEHKEKDPFARKITKHLIRDYGDTELAQEFINSRIAEIVDTSEKETLVSDGDNPQDVIEQHQSKETTTYGLNKHQLEEAKKLGISPGEYEKHLECQEWKATFEDELDRLQQAHEEHKLKETLHSSLVMQKQQLQEKMAAYPGYIEELKEWLADHKLADMATNEPEE